VFEPRLFRHGSVGHVPSPLRSKRNIVKAIACWTHAATAKSFERFGMGKPTCSENRHTFGYCAFDSRPLGHFVGKADTVMAASVRKTEES
jgi:hypothetical protein